MKNKKQKMACEKHFIKATSSRDGNEKKPVRKKRHEIKVYLRHCMISTNPLNWKRITTRCNNNSPEH